MIKNVLLEVRCEVHDQGRGRIRRDRWRRARSLLKQFAQLLFIQMGQTTTAVIDTGGTSRSCTPSSTALQVNAASGLTTWGIVVGIGTDPVTMTDYKLQSQVTTNIFHGPVGVSIENPAANVWRIVVSRPFVNNTGAVLGIREVGLYGKGGTVSYDICLDRSAYVKNLSPGGGFTFTYRVTIML